MSVTRTPSRPCSGSPAYSPDDRPIYRGGSSGASPSLILVRDDFEDDSLPDGDYPIADWNPDVDVTGMGWQETGTPVAFVTLSDSEKSFLVADGNVSQAPFETNFFDLAGYDELLVETSPRANGASPWLQLRYVDADSQFIVDGTKANGDLVLYEVVGGSLVERGRVVGGWQNTSPPRFLWASDDGETISVGTNKGAALITYNSTSLNSSKKIGVGKRTARDVTRFQIINSLNPGDLPPW